MHTGDAAVPEGGEQGAHQRAAEALALNLREQVNVKVGRVVVDTGCEHRLGAIADCDYSVFRRDRRLNVRILCGKARQPLTTVSLDERACVGRRHDVTGDAPTSVHDEGKPGFERDVRSGVNGLGFPGQPTPLARLLSEALDGLRVTCENDLNVAALGAAHGEGMPGDLAFLALGTGLGAGIVLDGRVRRGAFGAAGEIGHLTFDPDGPLCACGQRGCLEVYGSGGSIDARWPSDGVTPAPVALLAAAVAGDVRASEAAAAAEAPRQLRGLRSRPPKKRRNLAPLCLLSPAGLVLIGLTVAPIVLLVLTSFTDYGRRSLFTGKFATVGLSQYTKIFQDPDFLSSLVRTLAFTAALVLGSVAIGMAMSHLMTRLGRLLRTVVTVVLVFAWAVPNVASAMVWAWLFQPGYGVVNWFATHLQVFGDMSQTNWVQDPVLV